MGIYEDARSAERADRLGSAASVHPKGDFSHVNNIMRLAAGMGESVNFSNPQDKTLANHLSNAYDAYDNAREKHEAGDHMGAISYAKLLEHHVKEAGRIMAPNPANQEEMDNFADNYDPYIVSAASGAARSHLDSFIQSVNEGK